MRNLTFGITGTIDGNLVPRGRWLPELHKVAKGIPGKRIARDVGVWDPGFLDLPTDRYLLSIHGVHGLECLGMIDIIAKLRWKEPLYIYIWRKHPKEREC